VAGKDLWKRASISPHNTRDCMSEKGGSVGFWGKRGGRIVIDKVGVRKVELIGEGVVNLEKVRGWRCDGSVKTMGAEM